MRLFFNSIYIILMAGNVFAQYWGTMEITDPAQWGGHKGRATIESAIAEITPLDSYLDVQLELTFSGAGLNLIDTTQYEIAFYFDLPDRSIMHDLWLWIGDSVISKALIVDRWTASFTYNEIVGRKQDPAILFKRYSYRNESFELRIYPMRGAESRKVKLHFMLPVDWAQNNINCLFPFSIFTDSHVPIEDFVLRFNENSTWQNPVIPQFPEIKFTSVSDSTHTYLEAHLSQEEIGDFYLQFVSPYHDGIFVSKYETPEENYYQIMLQPSIALSSEPHKKVAVLLEHDSLKTTLTRKTVFQNIRNNILSNLSGADSFNVFFSGDEIIRKADRWLAVDSTNVFRVFNDDSTHLLKDSNNLSTLFLNAIDFIKNNGDDASILLFGSSDYLGYYEDANPLIEEILDSMETVLPVSVADYQNRNFQYYFYGNTYARGNEYFYENLTQKTDGDYYNVRRYYVYNDVNRVFEDAVVSLSGFITFFDLYPNLTQGFTYARIETGVSRGKVYLKRPVFQIGKYVGDFPMEVKITGFYNNEPFLQSIHVDHPVSSGDTLVSKIWAGNYIHNLETEYWWWYYDEDTRIEDILEYSLNYHVLSLYSSFLALEPGDTLRPCDGCSDPVITEIEEEKEVKIYTDDLSIAPNPFNSSTKIKLTFAKPFNAAKSNLVIFNILGQKVKTIDLSQYTGRNEFSIVWDGVDDYFTPLASGTYFLIFKYGEKIIRHKLLLLK